MYDLAHPREGLPAPIPKLLDFLVYECRSRFHRTAFPCMDATLAPIFAALRVTCNPFLCPALPLSYPRLMRPASPGAI